MFLLFFPELADTFLLPISLASFLTGVYLHLSGYSSDWQKLKNTTAMALSLGLFILVWGKSLATLHLLSHL